MKIFWWQNGLHLEPEGNEERTALILLLNSASITCISGNETLPGTSVLTEQGLEFFGGDSQGSPCDGAVVK